MIYLVAIIPKKWYDYLQEKAMLNRFFVQNAKNKGKGAFGYE